MLPIMRNVVLGGGRNPAVQGGVGIYANCGASTLFDLTTGITVEAIVNFDSFGSNHATIVSKENAYVLDVNYPDRKIRFWGKSGGNVKGIDYASDLTPSVSTTLLQLNRDFHIAGTFDGTTWTIYADGEVYAQGNSVLALDTNTNILRLFSRVDVRYLIGKAREVRLWNIARTQTEIRNNMKKGLVGNESGLVAYYPCDERGGTILHDRCNENNGVLSSASWGWMK